MTLWTVVPDMIQDSLGENTGVGCHALLKDLPAPRIEPESPMSPALRIGFFHFRATIIGAG